MGTGWGDSSSAFAAVGQTGDVGRQCAGYQPLRRNFTLCGRDSEKFIASVWPVALLPGQRPPPL
jgi:hypothetical protein